MAACLDINHQCPMRPLNESAQLHLSVQSLEEVAILLYLRQRDIKSVAQLEEALGQRPECREDDDGGAVS